jgi:hypothetical protein
MKGTVNMKENEDQTSNFISIKFIDNMLPPQAWCRQNFEQVVSVGTNREKLGNAK